MGEKVFNVRKPTTPHLSVEQIVFPTYKEGDTVVLFDGDILAFKVSSVMEYRFLFTHKQNSDEVYRAKSQKEFKAFLDTKTAKLTEKIFELSEAGEDVSELREEVKFWVYENFEIEKIQEAEPFEHCAKTLKDAHKRVLETFDTNLSEMYIGGEDNFRLYLPLEQQYKTSVRAGDIRPIHLTESKEFLCGRRFGGIKIKGREADDVLQMRAFQLASQGVRVIMYSNDKDRLQGWYGEYYNPDDMSVIELTSQLGEITESKKGCGLHWLLFQMSQGDPIDGYSPKGWYTKEFYRRGFGQKTYYAAFHDATSVKDLLERWIEVHKTQLLTKEFYEWVAFDGRRVKANWLGIMELMYSCAYMKLRVDDTTTFRGLCEAFGVDAGEYLFEVREPAEFTDVAWNPERSVRDNFALMTRKQQVQVSENYLVQFDKNGIFNVLCDGELIFSTNSVKALVELKNFEGDKEVK